jgi:hypothetical protein
LGMKTEQERLEGFKRWSKGQRPARRSRRPDPLRDWTASALQSFTVVLCLTVDGGVFLLVTASLRACACLSRLCSLRFRRSTVVVRTLDLILLQFYEPLVLLLSGKRSARWYRSGGLEGSRGESKLTTSQASALPPLLAQFPRHVQGGTCLPPCLHLLPCLRPPASVLPRMRTPPRRRPSPRRLQLRCWCFRARVRVPSLVLASTRGRVSPSREGHLPPR